MADKIHFLPVNPEFVADVIEKERPEKGVLPPSRRRIRQSAK